MRLLLIAAILAVVFVKAHALRAWIGGQGSSAGRSLRLFRWLGHGLTGDSEMERIDEAAVGADLAARVLNDYTEVTGTPSAETVSRIGDRLSAMCAARSFRFHVVRSNEVNAFALPGGHIFIATGLLETLRADDDALAFVLAHEMSHVISGDAAERTRVQMLARMLLHPMVEGFFAKAYSRQQELQADESAVRLLREAGFDPQGAGRLLGALALVVPQAPAPEAWLSTHPSPDERLAALELQRL